MNPVRDPEDIHFANKIALITQIAPINVLTSERALTG